MEEELVAEFGEAYRKYIRNALKFLRSFEAAHGYIEAYVQRSHVPPIPPTGG